MLAQVYDLDVWKIDGIWQVNDSFLVKEIDIDCDISGKEVIALLIENGFLHEEAITQCSFNDDEYGYTIFDDNLQQYPIYRINLPN